jgi:hypothetical protein
VDFDADGHDDLLSGSYDPGEIYLFRGAGGGRFEARVTLTDRSGKPILRNPEQEHPVESFGSWPAMVDWDGDGDLDLLYGGYDGSLQLRINEGTRKVPAFATKNVAVPAGGKPIAIPEGHCAPVVVDWDGDGRWDILSGGATGAVYWFRNVGKPGRPEFAAAEELVPRHRGLGYSEFLDAGAEPRPGIRSQIAVADVNGDGKPDLLLGDFCTYLEARTDLDEEERAELADLRAKQALLEPALATQREKMQEELKSFWKPYGIKEQLTAEVQGKYRALVDEIQARPDVKKLNDEAEAVSLAMKRFLKPAGPGALGNGQDTPRGYVWLFTRK